MSVGGALFYNGTELPGLPNKQTPSSKHTDHCHGHILQDIHSTDVRLATRSAFYAHKQNIF